MPGSDYTGITDFLIFSPFKTRDCVNISIATDDLVENDETFTVELSGNTDGALGVTMATVTILDVNSKFNIIIYNLPYSNTTPLTPQLSLSP